MKTKILVSISVSVLVGVLLAGGAASAARIKEPVGPDSTLLIGRIKLICSGFPKSTLANGRLTNHLVPQLQNR